MARWAKKYSEAQKHQAIDAMIGTLDLTAAEVAQRATNGEHPFDEAFPLPASTARAWKSEAERRVGRRTPGARENEPHSFATLERRTRSKIGATLTQIKPEANDAENRLLVVTKALVELDKLQRAQPVQTKTKRQRKRGLADRLESNGAVASGAEVSGS